MSVVTPTILSQGQEMDPAYGLLSIDISKEVNRVPDAQLVLLDGDVPKGEFPISDAEFFEPGKEIEIKLRYEGKPDATVFRGLVARHGIEVNDTGTILSLAIKDAAIKLTHPRRSNVFREMSDAEIVSKIVQQASLGRGTIESTRPKHQEIVQYHATDWDFIVSRAEILGLVVSVDDGEISLKKLAVTGAPRHRFELGMSEIFDLEIEADACHQYPAVEGFAWDLKKQKATPASQAKPFRLSQGNLDGKSIAKAIGFDTQVLSHPVPLDPTELQAWADAGMARSRMALIRGRLSAPGFADIEPLDVIEIAGVGDRFSGRALVTGIRHRVNDDGWRTDLQLGLSPDLFIRQADVQESPAAGLLPAVSGLQIGVVDKFEQDPDREFRVKVILPAIDQEKGTVWARLASPDAGKDRGYFFRPEVGDEVVVGFFNNDPRQAVILGAMFGSKNAPPEIVSKVTKDNVDKAIVTKKGTTIGFVDGKKASVFIETAQNNRILLDDEAQAIKISDEHGNQITMDDNGIALKSAKDLKIEANGNVEIKGQKVDVK